MIIAVRIIGAFLLVLAIANLAAVTVAEPGTLTSPATVAFRYSLMLIAAIGYLLARKWGVLVYTALIAFNWLAFFVIYEKQSIGPLWMSIPVPLLILSISFLAWKRLK